MLRLFLLALPMLYSFAAFTQTFEWVRTGSGIGQDAGQRVTTDREGNVIVVGYFSGEAVFNGTLFTGNGIFDAFIAKYNSAGDLLWLKSAGGMQNDAAQGVDTDAEGNIYITGFFTQLITFGVPLGGSASISLPSNGNMDIFIAKYDKDGNFLWAKRYGGPHEDRANDLKLDKSKNIYITGYISDRAYFNAKTAISSGSTDAFIAKFDSLGNCLWVETLGGSGLDKSLGMAIDTHSNVYMTGFFYYDAFLSNSSEVLNGDGLSSDIFIAKYNTEGENVWAKRIGGPFNDSGFAITVDKAQSIFITGYFLEIAFFGDYTLRARGYNDVYVAKYDSTLRCEWAVSEGGDLLDVGIDIALDKFGNVFVTGTFDSIAHFGNQTLYSRNYYDIWVAKYSGKGILIWALDAGGTAGDFPRGMCVAGDGALYVTGYYKKTLTLGSLQASWGVEADVFTTKISQPVGIADAPSELEAYVFPNPGTGLIHISLPQAAGEHIHLSVTDMQGSIIFRQANRALFNGRTSLQIDYPAPGIYLMHIETGGYTAIKKLVIF